MSAPRVQCEHRGRDLYVGRYKGHALQLERHEPGQPWYMLVTAPGGERACNGWVPDSAGMTQREAIIHALKGALLFP